MEEGNQKLPVASSVKRNIEDQHSVWLGLELSKDIESLDGISFFFNWINQPESPNWYPYLKTVEWTLGSGVLAGEMGYGIIEGQTRLLAIWKRNLR